MIDEIREVLPFFTDEERLQIFYDITKDYCRDCGSKYLPCYCNNGD